MTKLAADEWWRKRIKRAIKRFRQNKGQYHAAKGIIEEISERDRGRFNTWLEACHEYTRRFHASE